MEESRFWKKVLNYSPKKRQADAGEIYEIGTGK